MYMYTVNDSFFKIAGEFLAIKLIWLLNKQEIKTVG